ncbi:MAG: transposase [Oligoflexales bacterium]
MKQPYRVKNWKQYHQSLINPGNITVWFDEKILSQWVSSECSPKRRQPLLYSNHAIELGFILKSIYYLLLRQRQGFIEGLFYLLNIELQVSNDSTFSRRAKDVDVALEHIDLEKPIHHYDGV